MSLRLRNVQVDVPAEVHDAARAFWAEALGAAARAADGPCTHLDGARSPVGVHLQRLGEGPARVHLDLEASDPAGTVAHLEALGATHAWDAEDGPVLRDPAGLLLCVCPTGQPQHLADAEPGHAWLDRVVLDLPSARHDAALAFWASALDTVPHTFPPPFDAFTLVPAVAAPGGTVDLLLQDVGEGRPGIHVDLHVTDPVARDREVDRLVAHGARVVGRHRHWVVLHDPAGLAVCVVPEAVDSPGD